MQAMNFIHTVLFLTFFTSVTSFANDEKEFITTQTPEIIKLLNEAKNSWATKDKAKIIAFIAQKYYIYVESPEQKAAKIEELKELFMKRSEKALLNQAERITRVLGELIDVEPVFTAMPNEMYATFQKGKYKVRAMFSDGSWKIKF